MIVVEGPDGAGKSTLVKRICERYELKEAKHIGNRDDMYKSTQMRAYYALSDEVSSDAPPAVYDRCYFSELVYGPLWRDGQCAFSESERRFIEELLRVIDAPVIFCLPPLEVVRANIREGHQMKNVEPYIDKIWSGYMNHGRRFTGNSYMYDYMTTDLDYLLEMAIKPFLIKRKERQWQ